MRPVHAYLRNTQVFCFGSIWPGCKDAKKQLQTSGSYSHCSWMFEFLFHAYLIKRNWVCSTDKHSLPYFKKKTNKWGSFVLRLQLLLNEKGGEKKNPSNASMCILELVSTKVQSFEPAQLSFFLQIGGTEEYKICRGVKEGRITKPVVCWCIGTCATMFSSEVCVKMGANAWNKYISTTEIKKPTSLTVPKPSRIASSDLICRS